MSGPGRGGVRRGLPDSRRRERVAFIIGESERQNRVDAAGIASRLAETRDMIADAAAQSGRGAGDVELLAISKIHPPEAILAAYDAGQRLFGENYVQEALAKQEALAHLDIRWHFTGGLQSNKAKFLPGRFALIHTLDSLKLAQALHKKCAAACAPRQDVLIEVNLARESQKAGIAEEDLPELAEELVRMDTMIPTGLMILPPFDLDPEARRPLFRPAARTARRPCGPPGDGVAGVVHGHDRRLCAGHQGRRHAGARGDEDIRAQARTQLTGIRGEHPWIWQPS